jgi:hypothetical protein
MPIKFNENMAFASFCPAWAACEPSPTCIAIAVLHRASNSPLPASRGFPLNHQLTISSPENQPSARPLYYRVQLELSRAIFTAGVFGMQKNDHEDRHLVISRGENDRSRADRSTKGFLRIVSRKRSQIVDPSTCPRLLGTMQ